MPNYTDAVGTAFTAPQLWLRIVLGLLATLGVLAALFFVGPRNEFGPNTPTTRAAPPQAIAELDNWVKASEAAYTDIKPNNQKGIVWATEAKTRTPWAVVYLHGFSASRIETAPVADLVAKELGANLFYTRLTGHGRAGAAMGDASVQDWMADAQEAVRIGNTLGDRVLVIAVSTGATLATWFATSPDSNKVAAYAFVSPNFGPKDKRAELINGPWGKTIALTLEGETRGWTPANDREANGWTTSYPTRAIFPMMALVKNVRESDLSVFQTPVIMLYSEQDETVDPTETQAAFTRVGAPLKALEAVTYSKSVGQHVLAGDIKDPAAVAPMVTTITKWTKSLPQAQN
ncbi:alpha/beta hydrolase [Rhodoferax aquaticus]|uniref:Alpha/beta hydrolase n=1 Tax=Rhodoferax aquaticus TaxID=2527691 RepID=A0A515EP19_9BURK|nr:alpha/beta fold hydrolase [Rhodoferax aquaticus]QDL54417.1 alpha/beta hydrolase [Rhodoferax aquaticus]